VLPNYRYAERHDAVEANAGRTALLAHPVPVLQYGPCGFVRKLTTGETMSTTIKFGTSGWRAIVADEFTIANIRRAGAGIAAYVRTQPGPHGVLVGRDPRFLGESFVNEAARVLAAATVTPVVIPEAAPTPAIAYAVRTLKMSGAINFTASHNPPEYNGIKFSTPDGAPALPEVTSQIEAAIVQIDSA